MKKGALFIAFLICILFVIPAQNRAYQEERPDEDKQMALADHFMKIGEYSQAIIEYRRFLYLYPQSQRREEVHFKIAEAYYTSGQYEAAISFLKMTVQEFPEGNFIMEFYILMGRSLMGLKRLKEAREIFYFVIGSTSSWFLKYRARSFLAECYVMEERWKEAIEVMEATELDSPFRAEAERYASHLKAIDSIPYRSPKVAGILSAVLPGAGHLYCGRPMDALTAFIANSTLIAGAVEAFQKDQKGLGLVLSAIELVLYGGTIFSAVTSAHKFNRNEKGKYLDMIRIRMGYLNEERRNFLGISISY